MANLLKITTPVVNRPQAAQLKGEIDAAAKFPLPKEARVTAPLTAGELYKNHHGLEPQQREASVLLMGLLRDPSVTVGFLKNILMMQQFIRLLPLRDDALTGETARLFEQMMVPPGEAAAELRQQGALATAFDGGLFDFLRAQLRAHPDRRELQESVALFLKALDRQDAGSDALRAVANGLRYLARSMAPDKELSQSFFDLAARFESKDAPREFAVLQRQALSLMGRAGESILYHPDLARTVSITTYNLSRFLPGPEFFHEAAARLLADLESKREREELLALAEAHLQEAKDARPEGGSRVFGALTRLLELRAQQERALPVSGEQTESILRSLLSSPCNFTPLLHFVLPVRHHATDAFAEIWVDPQAGESRSPGDSPDVHVLLVCDVAALGRFELELYARQKVLEVSLLCPPDYAGAFAPLESGIPECVAQAGWRMGGLRVGALERPRSLMEVFHTLPYRRAGVDVKI